MFRLSFDIAHRGCWATDLSARWPSVSFALRSSVPFEGRARDVLSVRAESAETLAAVAKTLQEHPGVKAAVALDEEGGTGFYLVENRSQESLIEVITAHDGFLLGPTLPSAGIEHWTIGLAYRDRAKGLLEALGAHGPVRMQSLVRDTFPDLRLTDAQRRVLKAAIADGYYDFPRRTSPTDLAKRLGLAKSTVLEHLQKAEAKVILGQEGRF
ncbi:MAG TPA: helix-turn-helix domain-containing protein [Candidatus Thermoplasmatota archaeon]|nr:helix-turn-helix domain-containing protein [Candidatus Thermoplasmatota archaeon]